MLQAMASFCKADMGMFWYVTYQHLKSIKENMRATLVNSYWLDRHIRNQGELRLRRRLWTSGVPKTRCYHQLQHLQPLGWSWQGESNHSLGGMASLFSNQTELFEDWTTLLVGWWLPQKYAQSIRDN